MGVRFDTSRYPVVLVCFPNEGTEADIHAWYDEVERLLEAAVEPIAFVDDLRSIEFSKSNGMQRRIAAARHEGLTARYADKHAGNARIVGGRIAVAILRVFDWLSPAAWPVAVFEDESLAFAWCEARVGDARAPRESAAG